MRTDGLVDIHDKANSGFSQFYERSKFGEYDDVSKCSATLSTTHPGTNHVVALNAAPVLEKVCATLK